jgi:hypothetical protein
VKLLTQRLQHALTDVRTLIRKTAIVYESPDGCTSICDSSNIGILRQTICVSYSGCSILLYNVSSMIRSRCLHVHEHSAEIHHIRMIRGRLIDSEGRRQLRPLDVLAVEVTSSDVTEMARNVTRRWGQCRSFLTKHESVKHAV